ncbi:MAG: amidohydrolase [Pyrinomonadaceae bacterium]|nr:amidohydrolase [Pyrinomonadaceae bacterium]
MKSKVALIALTSVAMCLLANIGVGQQSIISSATSQITSAREQRITQMAEAMRARLIAQRRDFHIHPELSNREERTARVVAERLRELKFDEVRTNIARHGVVGILRGGRPGATIAVRADMDALPINEMMNVPYRSQNAGVKHACGHDVHTSVELGVAEILSSMRAEIPGTIKFIFQPAEEGAPAGEEGGAALMIKEGVLENPRPAAIFGLHVMPNIEVGQVGYNSGAAMASSDKFIITVHGKKVHGAYPHDGIDAVTVAAECITALQTIRSRRVDTTEPLVLSIGIVQGGNRFNIIADEVKLEGTVRTLNEDVRKRVQALMRETLAGVTSAYGASYEMQYEEGAAVTFNDPKLVEETLPVMRRVMGESNMVTRKPQMGAEDFSYYQRVVPGFFYFLGVGNKSKGITAMIHTPEFDVDEESLVIGTRLMSNVLLDYLERHAQNR